MTTTGAEPFAGDEPSPGGASRAGEWRLTLLFGALAFFQGLAEPTEGLLAQPVRTLLRSRGRTVSEITGFVAIVGLPWLLKPVYGMISDAVPLAGSRRTGYLVLSSVAAASAFLALFAFPAATRGDSAMLAWLTVATASVAFADVVTDGLMVDLGRPRGLTGRYQATQWASTYAAGFGAGLLGGELCERREEGTAFLICGVAMLLSLVAVRACVRPSDDDAGARHQVVTPRLLVAAVASPTVLAIAAFLFLWSLNPFTNAVLHLHMTAGLGFSERFYSGTLSLTSLSSIAASLAYGLYCRRVPTVVLAHASIALGVASTLGYLLVVDRPSAIAVTLVVGFVYMTATLIQLDLAAQHCPPAAAGTVFATLMALTNLAASLSVWSGGLIYERGAAVWGSRGAFRVLLLISASTTACCWFLTPILPRGVLRARDRGES